MSEENCKYACGAQTKHSVVARVTLTQAILLSPMSACLTEWKHSRSRLTGWMTVTNPTRPAAGLESCRSSCFVARRIYSIIAPAQHTPSSPCPYPVRIRIILRHLQLLDHILDHHRIERPNGLSPAMHLCWVPPFLKTGSCRNPLRSFWHLPFGFLGKQSLLSIAFLDLHTSTNCKLHKVRRMTKSHVLCRGLSALPVTANPRGTASMAMFA